jgi:hypothetical protein
MCTKVYLNSKPKYTKDEVLGGSCINTSKETDMFLDNKYTKWYQSLVANRQANPLEGYVERHHIIPHSLGGTDDSDNLVAFSAREHYIAHLLLARMTTGHNQNKMIKAAWMMSCQTRDYKVNSRLYESLRKEHARLNGLEERRKKTSESMKKYHSVNRWTDEMRQKARETALSNASKPPARKKGKGTFSGKTHSEESKARISAARKAYWAKRKG